MKDETAFRQRAREQYHHEGEIEVDDDAPVSIGKIQGPTFSLGFGSIPKTMAAPNDSMSRIQSSHCVLGISNRSARIVGSAAA